MAKTQTQDELTSKVTVIDVTLTGMTDIMFDRYAGDNKTVLEPWQKLYFGKDGKTLVLPSLNLMSFLSAQNTTSAPKRLLDSRSYKKTANAILSFVSFAPHNIPFLRDGKPIVFGALKDDTDPESGVYIHRSVARLKDGIPNPKERPVLPTPWELAFTVTMFPNTEIQEQQLLNLLQKGGIALGLGTFRGVFGKFTVSRWDKR